MHSQSISYIYDKLSHDDFANQSASAVYIPKLSVLSRFNYNAALLSSSWSARDVLGACVTGGALCSRYGGRVSISDGCIWREFAHLTELRAKVSERHTLSKVLCVWIRIIGCSGYRGVSLTKNKEALV